MSEARPIILAMEAEGHGPTAIGRHLMALGIKTPEGKDRWRHEQVTRHAHPDRWAAYMRAYRARQR